jgi:hypothetical protein
VRHTLRVHNVRRNNGLAAPVQSFILSFIRTEWIIHVVGKSAYTLMSRSTSEFETAFKNRAQCEVMILTPHRKVSLFLRDSNTTPLLPP